MKQKNNNAVPLAIVVEIERDRTRCPSTKYIK